MSELATSTTSAFELSSKTPMYTVYEITSDGHVLTSNFISKNRASEFSREFTDETSQVYIFKTKCIKVFDSSIIDTDSLKLLGEAAEYMSNTNVHEDGEDCEDPEYLPENDHNAGTDETGMHSIEIGAFEGLIFENYGRGYMLRAAGDMTPFYGEPYLLNGWWIDSQEGWFFKREHYDELIEYGATYAVVKSYKTKTLNRSNKGRSRESTPRRTTNSGKCNTQRELTFTDNETCESPFTEPRNLSAFAITEYGKGLMLTCAKTNVLVKDKEPYLLGNLGFWNAASKGWFFKMTYLSDLKALGAKHIKTEPTSDDEEYICDDDQFTQTPNFEKYGKGYILYANSKYTYNKLGKYFEGGFWMPQQKGWFFKTDTKNAFLANN